MYRTGLPSEKQVFDWMNAQLRNHASPIERLEDLTDGRVYIHIVNQSLGESQCSLELNAILSKQTNNDHFAWLSRLLKQKGLSFTFSIQKLAQPNLYEHFRLSIFLFQALRHPKETPKKMGLKVLPPRSARSVLLQKGVNVQMALSDLQCLHSKRRINQIKCSINQLPLPNIRLSDIQQNLVSFSKDDGHPQSAKQRIIVHLVTNQQRTHSKCFIDMQIDKAKQLQTSFISAYKIANGQRFFTFLRNLTVNYLRNKQYISQQTTQQSSIIDNFAKAKTINFKTFNDFFYQSGENENERRNIRKYCVNYYRSIDFLHIIVSNFYQRTKNKLNVITYLRKIELLPLRNMTQQQFSQFPKEYIDVQVEVDKAFLSDCSGIHSSNEQEIFLNESQLKIEERKVHFDERQPKQSLSQCKLEKESQMMTSTDQSSYAELSQEDHQFEELQISHLFNPNKEINHNSEQYWTVHRITLIVFQIQFIKTKDPDYDEDDLTHRSITQHTKFVTGLLLTYLSEKKDAKKRNPSVAVNNLIKSQKYPNLTRLFRRKEGTDEGDARLGEFVRILLSLKHDAVLHEFAHVYDLIVGQVQSVTFAEVKGRQNRFAFVERVTGKLRQSAAEIDGLLREMLSLEEGSENATVLLRTSVYCLLAERFAFHTNELWPVAFPQQKIKKQAHQAKHCEQNI